MTDPRPGPGPGPGPGTGCGTVRAPRSASWAAGRPRGGRPGGGTPRRSGVSPDQRWYGGFAGWRNVAATPPGPVRRYVPCHARRTRSRRPSRRRLRADRARQLADLLRHRILAGGSPGGVLPLEDVIAADYRASRNTVRQALDLLRGEQLVDRQPGVGTVVVGEKYPHGLDRLQGLAEILHEHGRVTNEVRTVGPVGAPGPVTHRLGLPEHSDVLCIERLRRLDGLPLSLGTTRRP
ncbi:GntR family transcriptional regulator, partial [Streptomyces sp. SID2131]|nr:GntR family transcriptional regulator [Streptomyces sp. SID2131]